MTRKYHLVNLFKREREKAKLPSQSQRIEQVFQGEERSKRQERAHRILNAAAELVQRWGYKKTTIDDIAKQAKVAKGTIYLHWKNREDLFMALFLREALDAGYEMFERMENDPEGFLLHNQTKHSIYVTMSRPLITALYLGDAEILGELIHSDHPLLSQLMQSKAVASEEFFELMRGKGIIRTDMSIRMQRYTYTAIIMGFMTVERYLPKHLQQQYSISLEEAVDALARTIHSTFEPDEPVPASTMQEIRTMFTQFYQQYLTVVKEQLQKEMDL
jgi:AcrR family transcriptional regulator